MKPNRAQRWVLTAAFVIGVYLGAAMQGGLPAAAESGKLSAVRKGPGPERTVPPPRD